ncbi:MAG TPA: glycosyltransferase 87 family protein [Roseiflexaceae bacterium]|nr:glycosyltransferase 87 family protein [Roseiflexaceae bacterium]
MLKDWRSYVLLAAAALLVGMMHAAYSGHYHDVDLAYPWLAARMWLSGIDPYGAEATFQLTGSRSPATSGFPYPFPVVLLALPLAPMPLAWAATVWACVSLGAALALPLALLERPPAWLIALPLLYFPMLAAIEEAQWAPILLAFALASVALHRTGRHLASGILLPLALLKPQLGIALVVAVGGYVLLRGAPRRWWYGLALGLALWWGLPLALMPSWPLGWLEQLRRYSGEGQNSVIAFSVPGAALALTMVGLAALAARRRDAELLLAMLLAGLMLLLPMRSVYNETLLLLPLVLLAGRAPRATAAALLASWGILLLLAFRVDQSSGRALAFYAPLVLVALVALGARTPALGTAPRALEERP